jgi:hypothetical protein
MRITARRLVEAAKAGKSRKVGNSSVEVNHDGSIVFRLHGNAILDIDPEGAVSCSLAGRPTATTRSRINDLFRGLDVDANLHQEDGVQYLRIANTRLEAPSTGWTLAGWVRRPL